MTVLESGRLAIKRLSSNSLTRMLRWTPQYIRRTPSRTRRPLTYGHTRIKKKEKRPREKEKTESKKRRNRKRGNRKRKEREGIERERKEGIERERKERE
jgi:hypothetical protein